MAMSVFRFARRTWASEDLEHIAPVPLPKMATPAVVLRSLAAMALPNIGRPQRPAFGAFNPR
jgi:oligopeptide transport system permease protein